MTIKHTQGSWKAVFKHGQSGPDYYNIVDNDDVKLCEVIDTSTADLIASAPDMLEALEDLLRDIPIKHRPIESFKKAIQATRKAKGEL